MYGSHLKIVATVFVCIGLLAGGMISAEINNGTTNKEGSPPVQENLAIYEGEIQLSEEPVVGEKINISLPVHQLGETDIRTYHDGDYGEYDFYIEKQKTIDIRVRMGDLPPDSSNPTGYKINLDQDELKSGDISAEYKIINISDIEVDKGNHTLRLTETTDGHHQNLKFDWIEFGDIHREAELFDRTGTTNGEPELGYDQIFPHGIQANFYIDGEKIGEEARIGTNSRYLPRLDQCPYGPDDSIEHFITNNGEKNATIEWTPQEAGKHELKINLSAVYRPGDSDLSNNVVTKTIEVKDEEDGSDEYVNGSDLAVFGQEIEVPYHVSPEEEVQIKVPVHQLGVTKANTYHDGDYGEYEFEVSQSGQVDIAVRIKATNDPTGTRVKLDGDTISTFDSTAGYEIVTLDDINVTSGTHTVRVAQTTDCPNYGSGLQLDWIKFGEIHREGELFDNTGAYNGEPKAGYDNIGPHHIDVKYYIDGNLLTTIEDIGDHSRYIERYNGDMHFIPNDEASGIKANWSPDSEGQHEIKIKICKEDTNNSNNIATKIVNSEGDSDNDTYPDEPDLAVFDEEIEIEQVSSSNDSKEISVPVHQLGLTWAIGYHDGDYGEYDFQTAEDKTVDIKIRIRSPEHPTPTRVKLDGEKIKEFDSTPGFKIVTISDIQMDAGERTLRIEQTGDTPPYGTDIHVDWIKVGQVRREAGLFDETGAYNGEPVPGYDNIRPHDIDVKYYIDGELLIIIEDVGDNSRYIERIEDKMHFIPNQESSSIEAQWTPESEGQHEIKIEICKEDANNSNNIATKTIQIENGSDDPEDELSADFSYGPQQPTTQDVVQFTDQSTLGEANITDWMWSFGDGESSIEQNPNHIYHEDGNYTVSLKVIDKEGNKDVAQKEITVKNEPPKADIQVLGETEIKVRMTGVPNNSVEAVIYEDNTVLTSMNVTRSPGPPNTQESICLLSNERDYELTLIYDSERDGANPTWVYFISDQNTEKIKVTFNTNNGDHQERVFDVNQEVNRTLQGTNSFVFSAAGSYDLDGKIIEYEWSLGDGTNASGAKVEHEYTQPGNYTVELTVRDNDEADDSQEVSVYIGENPQLHQEESDGFEISGLSQGLSDILSIYGLLLLLVLIVAIPSIVAYLVGSEKG